MSDGDDFSSRYRMPTAAERASAKRLVALYDYESTLDDDADIALTTGEVVFGVELNGEWWWGYNTKRSGMFPATYVREEGVPMEEDSNERGAATAAADATSSNGASDDPGEDAAALPPPSPPRRRKSNEPHGGGAAAATADDDEDGPDPFAGEEDDDDVAVPALVGARDGGGGGGGGGGTAVRERPRGASGTAPATTEGIAGNIPGLNVQWVLDDNLVCAHEVLLWNGNFSSFVRAKLLLTENFLAEAIYYTPDLPEVTVYPLHKLYIDRKQKIGGGFMKRPYVTLRSQYYFCNLSTTAFGGKHNELVTTLRERYFTFPKGAQYRGKNGVKFLRALLAALVKAKDDYEARQVEYIRGLPGYALLYDPSPPHFDQKIKDLTFATDIVKKMVDAFVPFEELKFVLER